MVSSNNQCYSDVGAEGFYIPGQNTIIIVFGFYDYNRKILFPTRRLK